MFKGFYTLSSGMLNENRNLNVISNNLTNVSTPGFKADQLISGTFKDEIIARTGNNSKNTYNNSVGRTSMIVTPYETVTNFESGGLEETGGILDFAIMGDGFFQVNSEDGVVYTRNGSFSIDDEGYLFLNGTGRVLGKNGPIQLKTDNFQVESDGSIIDNNGNLMGQLNIVEFDNLDELKKVNNGVFSSDVQGRNVDGNILWKYVERSNVDPVKQMTSMMMSQRSLQSAAQVLKMYDQLAARATTEIGKV